MGTTAKVKLPPLSPFPLPLFSLSLSLSLSLFLVVFLMGGVADDGKESQGGREEILGGP